MDNMLQETDISYGIEDARNNNTYQVMINVIEPQSNIIDIPEDNLSTKIISPIDKPYRKTIRAALLPDYETKK